MVVFKKPAHLQTFLQNRRRSGETIGFVPTMGALHPGHLSLLAASRNACSLTVASIFVNPAQFNNPDDFNRYPVNTEKDIELLIAAGCEVLFLPAAETIYPADYIPVLYDLGYLEKILEGTYRPGHFQGVCRVMDRLLQIIQPDDLFMGQKDLQQCMVVKKLLADKKIGCRFHQCPTLREADGLAMSSRNIRLTQEQRVQARGISAILNRLKDQLVPGHLDRLTTAGRVSLEEQGFRVDYLDIARTSDLELIREWDGKEPVTALAAAFLGDVRLIDNLTLNKPA